jgi:hypothetical protein
MEELIFFGVIILFSILESIARSRKAKQSGEGEDADPRPDRSRLPDLSGRAEWEPERRLPQLPDLPTYDEDPSYDDGVGAGASRAPRRDAPSPMRSGGSAAETMLPAELLEELAELAGRVEARRGGARTVRTPKTSPSLPEWRDERGQGRSRLPVRVPTRSPAMSGEQRPDHAVHRSHRGYGTDPSERARSEQDGLDPLAVSISEDVAAVRRQLGSHSPSSLRRALILQEVLGPPAALRDGPIRH